MEIDKQYEMNKYDASALLEGFGNTDICVFMYYPLEKRIEVPQKACEKYYCKSEYENMPYSFADDFVHPDDYPAFIELYHKIDQGEKTATARFHSKDKSACCRVTLTALSKKGNYAAREVLGVIEDISDWDKDQQIITQMQVQLNEATSEDDAIKEARIYVANAIGTQYFALYHIWLEKKSYVCFQEQLSGILEVIGETGDYEPAWDSYISNYIEPEDQLAMYAFADIDTMAERLRDKQMISHEYRRREIGWTRGQFIVAKRDAQGMPTNIIYTVTDINAEKTMEIKQNQAIFEAHHDPLTGAYNRKALEEIVVSPKHKDQPIGFAIVDVDNFKIVNDAFGHEMGDQILTEVTEMLTNVFRSRDYVFRIGGDEFAVLLCDCSSAMWKTICQKQHGIHAALDELYKDTAVTLSIGIAFSANGYSEEVFRKADERLYEVKQKGRAGCAMIDMQTGQMQYWRDDDLSFKAKNVLEFNNTGLYRIEYPLDLSVKPRLFCGEMTRKMFDFPQEATPEECYQLWQDNIDPSYLEILGETRQELLRGIQAECTYQWNHPKLGKIFVRTGGTCEVIDDMQILHGYHHSMENTKIMERKDDQQLLIKSMSGIYFCSYYVDLDRDSFYTMKNAPGEKYLEIQESKATDAMQQFLATLVSPEYMNKMTVFMNLKTLHERMEHEVHLDCEYLSRTEKGWCRATFFPVKRDLTGRLTHVLFMVTSLDERKAQEARKGAESRKSIETLYNNVPGGIVMYEWDGKKLKTVHISAYFERKYGYTLKQGEKDERGPDFEYIHPDDLIGYQKAILKALTETHELHYDFRGWNESEKRYAWIHIDATSTEQKDGTSLVYALYTDVTSQKQLEQELEKSHKSMTAALGASNLLSYEYDPITHVGTCFTEENYFGLPTVIENYPDSLKEIDLFHPEDADTFLETAHRMDADALAAHCDVRIKRNGQYRWYSCFFNAYYDLQKEHKVAILTVIDISERKTMLDDYEARLASLSSMVEDSFVVGQCNITNNTVDFFKSTDEMKMVVEGVQFFDERVQRNIAYIVGEKVKKEFLQIFNRSHLLKLAEQGNMQVKMEYMFRIPDHRTIWLETGVNMVRNPLTGEVTAISYTKNIRDIRIAELLLESTLNQDYMKNIVVLTDTDEFYAVNNKEERQGESRYHFWRYLNDALRPLIGESGKILPRELDKATILKHLEKEEEYRYSFDSHYYEADSRLQIRFRYLQKSQNLLHVSLRNITDTILMDRLRHDSEHDPLTDLYNRKTVFRKCREMLDEHPEEQFVMAHVDLRHFRLYNTFFGEAAGDQLLCDVADLFRRISGDYDHWVYGRIDADVFCAFLPYNKDRYEKHVSIAIELLKNYRADFLVEPVLGLYFVTDCEMPIDAMFTRATLAAKSVQTRMPYATVIYDETLEQKLTEEQQVLNDMQTAIEEEQFEVYLQPKYSLQSSKAVGAEALVRWKHPQRGMISPGVFIPIFESNGFITTLDRYMWEHVCMVLSEWKKKGKPLFPISVNVSRLSMFSKSTVECLKEIVKKYEVEPEYLELELTESAYIDDSEEMRLQMFALREAGFRILLDDFGSGYSGLNTLREMPVDILKMDMKFLNLDQNDVRGGIVISSIVHMARQLELTVIAEGVETQEQADFLKDIGCEYVQGFLFARPMTVADYENMVLFQQYEEK